MLGVTGNSTVFAPPVFAYARGMNPVEVAIAPAKLCSSTATSSSETDALVATLLALNCVRVSSTPIAVTFAATAPCSNTPTTRPASEVLRESSAAERLDELEVSVPVKVARTVLLA